MAVKLGDVIKDIALVLKQGEHRFDARKAQIIKGAPAKKGGRVSYALVECSCGCGGVKVAPKKNFLACTKEHIEKIKELMKKNKLKLI